MFALMRIISTKVENTLSVVYCSIRSINSGYPASSLRTVVPAFAPPSQFEGGGGAKERLFSQTSSKGRFSRTSTKEKKTLSSQKREKNFPCYITVYSD